MSPDRTSPSPLASDATFNVACLGASITAARGSFDWIAELERRPGNRGFRFHRFGVGGDLAYNALQRLSDLIACRPRKVVILIGHNDVVALVSRKVRRIFRVWKHLPCKPSPEWYGDNLRAASFERSAILNSSNCGPTNSPITAVFSKRTPARAHELRTDPSSRRVSKTYQPARGGSPRRRARLLISSSDTRQARSVRSILWTAAASSSTCFCASMR